MLRPSHSGTRDITLAGQPNSNRSLTIDIAGKNGDSSDDLTLAIFQSATASIGSNLRARQVAWCWPQRLPVVLNLGLADPFPVNAVFMGVVVFHYGIFRIRALPIG